jgi:hypothetical protein
VCAKDSFTVKQLYHMTIFGASGRAHVQLVEQCSALQPLLPQRLGVRATRAFTGWHPLEVYLAKLVQFPKERGEMKRLKRAPKHTQRVQADMQMQK